MQRKADPEDVAVDVRGIKKLHLQVECPGSFENAHAVWIEPRVLKSK